ncbi:MAG: ABC transporter permease [Gammaproteobacteria bacterium]|nr:ABC transporter permease [Gammaproteobacteria bacterium]
MSESVTAIARAKRLNTLSRLQATLARAGAQHVVYPVTGIAVLLGLWWLGGLLLYLNPTTRSFSGLGPVPTFRALFTMLADGEVAHATASSLYRIGLGLLYSAAVGLPIGIVIGLSRIFRETTNVPFQFLRMISPLSWEPIAVLAFVTWDEAIIFLITMASVWSVIYATANGVSKIDPAWFKIARNLGARRWHMLSQIVLPAVAQDMLTGMRFALGIAWIVLVPAEFLGVTSGLGYAIEDARETLQYSHLGAMVFVIGIIGFSIDSVFAWLVRRYSWVRQK